MMRLALIGERLHSQSSSNWGQTRSANIVREQPHAVLSQKAVHRVPRHQMADQTPACPTTPGQEPTGPAMPGSLSIPTPKREIVEFDGLQEKRLARATAVSSSKLVMRIQFLFLLYDRPLSLRDLGL